MIEAKIVNEQNKFKVFDNAIKDLIIKTKIKSKSVDQLITIIYKYMYLMI